MTNVSVELWPTQESANARVNNLPPGAKACVQSLNRLYVADRRKDPPKKIYDSGSEAADIGCWVVIVSR